MGEPTHQLVVQFPEDAFSDFDALVNFEDILIEALGDRHDVDGHDVGSGEVNFFVLTDNPNAAVAEIRDGTGPWLDRPDARAAARLVDGDDYELLWPKGDTKPFKVI